MRTSPACTPCFEKQIRYAASLVSHTKMHEHEIIATANALLKGLDPNISPPENAVAIYSLIAKMANNPDPFSMLKKASTEQALELKPAAENIVRQAVDPLQVALRLAICGNIMDYGALQSFNIEKTLGNCLNRPLAIDDSSDFKADLKRAKNILYLGDNCGELIFDALLIETMDKDVTLAVKEHPIINDATLNDVAESGLPQTCRVITNGTGCPGTPLASCSPAFHQVFNQADLIISKGQGNFETLSEVDAPIYFLLTIKCDIVAQHLRELTGEPQRPLALGDLVLLKNNCQFNL